MVFGDWRLRFGKIEPSMWVHGNEFRQLLVEGVEMFVVTLGIEEFDEDDYAAAIGEIHGAARRLDARGVDCIISGGTPAYTHAGTTSEDRLIDEMEDELDARFCTSLRAHVDALRALDAESLLVLTPYPPAENEERRRYLQDRDFEVVSIGGIHTDAPREITGLSTGATYRIARDLAREADDFDAVYISNPQWESARFVEALEADLDRPVVATGPAQVWKAYELASVSPNIEGYGSLFETL